MFSWPSACRFRVAVVGVGSLGRHHARILSTLPGVSLTAVSTSTGPRRRGGHRTWDTSGCFDAHDLVGHVDAVTVAVRPRCMRRSRSRFSGGRAVLVEKPMERTLAEADAMIARRRAAARRWPSGTRSGSPRGRSGAIGARRSAVHRSPQSRRVPERSLDIDVVFDDDPHLDVALRWSRRRWKRSRRSACRPHRPRRHRERAAALHQRLHCQLTASRISRDRVRKIRFFQPSATCRRLRGPEGGMWRLVKGAGPLPRSRAARSRSRRGTAETRARGLRAGRPGCGGPRSSRRTGPACARVAHQITDE